MFVYSLEHFLTLIHERTPSARRMIKFVLGLSGWVIAAPLAFVLRLSLEQLSHYLPTILTYLTFSLVIKVIVFAVFALHRHNWRVISFSELVLLTQLLTLGTALIYLAMLFVPVLSAGPPVPKSIPLLDGILGLMLLVSLRTLASQGLTLLEEHDAGDDIRRVLLVGANDDGLKLAQNMEQFPHSKLKPIGFIDPDAAKANLHYFGLPVYGTPDQLEEVIVRKQIDDIVIASRDLQGGMVRRIFETARQNNVRCRITPRTYEPANRYHTLSDIRDIRIEDMLYRPAVDLDMARIAAQFRGKTVLITGAGGSIGSELVQQVAGFDPARLVLVGRGEGSLAQIKHTLMITFPQLIFDVVLTDIRNRSKLQMIFRNYLPDIVFHTAAHKHVPMMESNPDEAVLNNINGAQNVVDCALDTHVKRLINISTDKAVNPTSVMGASKRMTEYIVACGAQRAEQDQVFVSVRFGNVLGSRGSVVPIFQQQIASGGPVTVTHPEMTRYFMTIPEAAQLVIQAASYDQNGRVYVLDMGEPIKIDRLARDLITLAGLEAGRDIPIIYTGMRAGERLYEELLTAEEGSTATMHQRIFAARQHPPEADVLNAAIRRLNTAAAEFDYETIRQVFKDIVPNYQPYHYPDLVS